MVTQLQRLLEMGQSPWYDDIHRGLVNSGKLQTLISMGIRGATVNPTIFEKALAGSADYDDEIRELLGRGLDPSQIYERLLIEDVRSAADLFRPILEETGGLDGYVSIEVSPYLAHDTRGTVEEARRFFREVARANVMIKVPATDEGVPAIRQLTGEGINVNITLIFGIDYYEQVMDAYIGGLHDLRSKGEPIDRVTSVASFFVSRVDVEVDRRLDALIEAEQNEEKRRHLQDQKGKAAIANARLAYQHFKRKFYGETFRELRAAGARVQRPLWASSGAKNPAYRDVMYVEQLIGPDTINTMPAATIEAFEDHGQVSRTIDGQRHFEETRATMQALSAAGINMKEVTDKLQLDGIEAFAKSLESFYAAIRLKQAAVTKGKHLAASLR
ncbi:MAG TPA: transaldolase [Chloroflexia bacterium]|nr:transaldolase [Chloroflexia bacterium]